MKRQSLVIPLIVLVLVALAVGSINLPRYFRLSTNGIIHDAQVTAKEPENHRLIRYSFNLNGEKFLGVQGVGDEITKLNLGQQIQIHYYANDPTINCYCEPKTMLLSESFVVVLAGIGAALFVGIFLYFLSRRGSKVQTST